MAGIQLQKSKPLSVFTLTMINIIAIDSLRNLPMNATYGLSIGFYYLLGAILFLIPTALITAELATHHPRTGGTYLWVKDAFGPRWGFANIWLQWIYNVIWYPTILSFIAASVAYLINPDLSANKTYMVSMIIGVFLVATFINSFGIQNSARLSVVGAIVGTLLPMAFLIGLAFYWLHATHPVATPITLHALVPDFSHLPNLAFLVVILFSLMGLEMSSVHAGDVGNPKTDYPKALWWSSILIVLTLVFSSSAIAIVLPPSAINIVSGVNEAFAAFLQQEHLSWALPIAVLMIILGGFAGMSAWVIGPTRGLMVAAEEGCLPHWFARKNLRGAPITVLIAQAIIVCLLCTLFYFFQAISTAYWVLSDLTAQLALVYYIILFAAAIRLRYKTPVLEHAYRIPFGNVGIWVVGLVGITTCVVAIILGFLIPADVPVDHRSLYEWTLILGMVIFFALPFLIYSAVKRTPSLEG
ncbi:MAG TPA: amino acid permease [Coxiellaceae bacterium]|nr:amino acid permease [Coxiellaceae bacterium]